MEDIDNLKTGVDKKQADSGGEATAVGSPEAYADGKAGKTAGTDARKDKKAAEPRTWRDGLYGRIDVPVRTMDIIIWTLVVLIILALLFGIISGHRAV